MIIITDLYKNYHRLTHIKTSFDVTIILDETSGVGILNSLRQSPNFRSSSHVFSYAINRLLTEDWS